MSGKGAGFVLGSVAGVMWLVIAFWRLFDGDGNGFEHAMTLSGVLWIMCGVGNHTDKA